MEKTQPWITCYLTDILLEYVKETVEDKSAIDYPSLFKGIEGFEIPPHPEAFLTDVNNWVPLSVLRELEIQCEKISGKKDIAYHAAKAYFTPGKKQLSSLLEIIVQVLNDVRSTLIFANTWGASQTNYLKLQSFEKQGNNGQLYMLSQFDAKARPGIGAINLVRGFCEGFPRLYPFIQEVHCINEISQMRLEDLVGEFPHTSAARERHLIVIRLRSSGETIAKATRVMLTSETVTLSQEFMQIPRDAAVVAEQEGQIEVLTRQVENDPRRRETTQSFVYQITAPGVLSHGPLMYSLQEGQIYNAPYSRFRIMVKEKPVHDRKISAENLRKEVSKLLFEHLRAAKQAHTQIAQISTEKRQLALENIRLRQEVEREYSFSGIIGQSNQIQELFALIRSIAETDVAVLLQGETGTGKELIARAIHYNSRRKAKRFVALNCGALSLTLLESELFGHEKGAFTGAIGQKKGIFEAANGGTLFLDEIGDITPTTQVKLLRVLQEGELQRVGGTDTIKVDVRIIAATNQNLDDLVNEGRFRQDLYYRLKVFPVMVPPLRDRREDIPLLVSHFIEKFKHSMHREITGVSPQAMSVLIAQNWLGNIRELENSIQRMMVVAKSEVLDVADLPIEIRGRESESKPASKDLKEISRESAEIAEKRAILDALEKTGGNVTKAAKSLGTSRATLQNKMKQYRLRDKE